MDDKHEQELRELLKSYADAVERQQQDESKVKMRQGRVRSAFDKLRCQVFNPVYLDFQRQFGSGFSVIMQDGVGPKQEKEVWFFVHLRLRAMEELPKLRREKCLVFQACEEKGMLLVLDPALKDKPPAEYDIAETMLTSTQVERIILDYLRGFLKPIILPTLLRSATHPLPAEAAIVLVSPSA